MATIQYITTENERWDNVAFKAYGNAALSEMIIVANPEVDVTDVLEAGTVLNLPVIEDIKLNIAEELLPPWKR